ncbi:MAG: FtsX-like permease family protein [Pseudomonadota bacterium]|nr:MAG: hypothetical protein DIU78_14420 [Pseudomonadota bacterium]
MHVLARLAPGTTLEQAQANLAAVAAALRAAHPESNDKKSVRVLDLHEYLVGASRGRVLTLFACVALAFLIVCANVATLLLARAQTRQSELAIRAALGASPGRLGAQIVTETAVIFCIGAVGGAVVAELFVDFFARDMLQAGAVAAIDVRVDAKALLACVVLSLGCGLLFGLVPAWVLSRVQPASVLKESSVQAGPGPSQRTARNALVVVEAAVAVALSRRAVSRRRRSRNAPRLPPVSTARTSRRRAWRFLRRGTRRASTRSRSTVSSCDA